MRNSIFWAGCMLGAALGLWVPTLARAQQPDDGAQASQDADQRAEAQRRAEIDRQRQLVDQMRLQAAWPNTSYVYGYAYVYGPRRGYHVVAIGPPAIAVLPRAPSDCLAPYGYTYHPWYGQSPQRFGATLPYRPAASPLVPPPPAALNDAAPIPAAPAPEPIPAPPAVSGPREF